MPGRKAAGHWRWCWARWSCFVGQVIVVLILSLCADRFADLLLEDTLENHLDELLTRLIRHPWPLVTARQELVCKLDLESPLRTSLPAGVLSTEVDLLRLKGHLGDPSTSSPALQALLKHVADGVPGVAVVNPSGCGKTKAVLDLLRVSTWVFCSCVSAPLRRVCATGALGILRGG